jgi:hypothetical protein
MFTGTDEGAWYAQDDWYDEGCDDCGIILANCVCMSD